MTEINVLNSIKELLEKNKITFSVYSHEPVFTSGQAAKVRGRGLEEGLKRGAKAIIVRSEGKFYQFIIPANKQLDFKKVKKILKTKSASFASIEEVKQVTNCTPGSVPHFGNLFNIQVFAEKSLLENKEIDFNAGKHETSITMKCQDWIKVVQPLMEEFSE